MSGGVLERLAGGGEGDRLVPVPRSAFLAGPDVRGGAAALPPRQVPRAPDGASTFAACGARLPVLLPGSWKDHDEAPLVAVLRGMDFVVRVEPAPPAAPPPPAAGRAPAGGRR